MLKQQGRVLEQSGGWATVLLGPVTGCPACAAGKGCGAGIFGRLVQGKPVRVQLKNLVYAQPGDTVVVGIAESLFLNVVLRLYLWPVLMFIVAAGFGNYLASRLTNHAGIIDGFSLFLGTAGAGLALAWSRATGKEPGELATVELLQVLNRTQIDRDCSALQR